MNRLLTLALLLGQSAYLNAQHQAGITDSVFQIGEVRVMSNQLEYFSVGNKLQTLDSSMLAASPASNLVGVLRSSQVQVNNYGLGLSQPSMRGTGTSHAAVLWNGLNLQDVLNGGVDCSLVPMLFVDDIRLQYGGASALFGSGAIGGAIHLNNRTEFNKGFSSQLVGGYGSYDNRFGGIKLNYGNSYYSGTVRSYYNTALNNFRFRNVTKANSPIEKQQNADQKQIGLFAGNAFKISNRSKLESFFWYQDNDKNIAPKMTETSSNNNQADRFYRAMASYKTWGQQSDFTLRYLFSNTFMTYNKTDDYQSMQNIAEAEYNQRLASSHLINAGLRYAYEKGESDNLISHAHRNRISLFTSYRFTSPNSDWKLVVNLRDEMINQELTPVTFSLGTEYSFSPVWQAKAVVSKNYRVPTFNDLYWTPGGNPDLKNESGFNQELTFAFTPIHLVPGLSYEITGFSNVISELIAWLPTGTGSIWSPENVSKVWARGIENELSASLAWGKLQIKPSASYSYVKSTKIKADAENDPAYRKQLIYVPVHKGLFALTLLYKGYALYYAQNYSSERYTSKDNSKSVDAYAIGNLSVSSHFELHRYGLTFSFQVNNVWDTDYQVMPYYAMPLRNYQLNVQLNFK